MNDELEVKLNEFEEWCQGKYAAYTTMNTMRSMRHLVREGVDLDRRETFREWILTRRKKGVLDRTLNNYIKYYNRWLEYGNEKKIKSFKTMPSFTPKRSDMDEYHKLMDACRGYSAERMRLMVDLLFKTGIRIGELQKITLDDIQDDQLRVTGKGQKTRTVYLPESIRGGTLPGYLRVRRAKQGIGMLFTNMFGEPLTYDGIRGDVYNLARRAGVHFSPHMARRFYARFLYKQGYDLELIRQILGHEKLDTTKKYMQVDQKDVVEAMREKKPDFFLGEANLL